MGLLDAVALPSVKDGEVHDGILAQSTRFRPSETSRAGELNRDSVIAGGACGPAGEDNSLASVRPPAVCPNLLFYLTIRYVGVDQSEAAVEGNALGRDSPQDLSSLFFGPYDKGRYQT